MEKYVQNFYSKTLKERGLEIKRSLGRPRCRGEDNIKIDLCGRVEHMEWAHLNHDGDPLEGYYEHAMNLMVP
jgi:hypothetical protein